MTRRPALTVLVAAILAVWLAGCASDPAANPAPSPASSTPDGTMPRLPATGDARPGGTDREGGRGWATLTDGPSGASFALPGRVDRWEDTAAVDDGSEVPLRNYSATADDGMVELGFNVIDTPGESYDLDAGVGGVEESLDGAVVDSTDTEVDGYSAVDVELSYGDDMLMLFQLIRADEHVMQPLVSGPEADRGTVEAAYEQLNTSVEVN